MTAPLDPYLQGLRDKVGQDLLWLSGVTAVVLRDGAAGPEVLLVRRADNGAWTPVTGIVDPGEDVDTAAVREIREETTLSAVVERVVWVLALPVTTYPNGDVCQFLDTTVLCRVTGGEARIGDAESTAVGWFPVTELPVTSPRMRRQIEYAASGDHAVLFGMEGRRPGGA
ncbi:NUDIX domain-containing protein [Flexivirga sp. ID2601S]|uniref:NUDIX domain-containing protein n=1 Tax=Flexivirga aerilata TaxID=1656889 RepID=A0A849AFJ9_9MICO|nr:NUDIX domain-containing protein [Flexivirga aerilata]NNG38356.1 NUDIX domain-containing protein [Flexivirga aerilata]